jgi:hypothetical protein
LLQVHPKKLMNDSFDMPDLSRTTVTLPRSGSLRILDPLTCGPAQFISLEERSNWLGPIYAGRMAMIIGACHSVPSVNRPGFKPGPMGGRGLGQLAYDKAIGIVTAQANDIALRIKRPSICADGKYAVDANHDGKPTLAPSLRHSEQYAPALFEDIKAGRTDAICVRRDSRLEIKGSTTAQSDISLRFCKDRDPGCSLMR